MTDEPVEILLVEDNPNDLELTLHALRKHRLANSISVARDGAEALDFLFCTGEHAHRTPAGPPKLILLDLKLPKLSGLQVLRRVREDPRTANVPIVVLTSSSEDRDIAEAYRLGANSYIVKPVDFEQFSKAAEQLGMYWLLLNKRPG